MIIKVQQIMHSIQILIYARVPVSPSQQLYDYNYLNFK